MRLAHSLQMSALCSIHPGRMLCSLRASRLEYHAQHSVKTQSQDTTSKHRVKTPCQNTESKHHVKTHSQNTMSKHHVETPCWLQVAEQQRKEAVQAALLVMTHAMNDIAHLSPGEVERLVEQQALDLNLSMLDNRFQHPLCFRNLPCMLPQACSSCDLLMCLAHVMSACLSTLCICCVRMTYCLKRT